MKPEYITEVKTTLDGRSKRFDCELLRLDPALVFAQQGRDRARLLASLTARAQGVLNDKDFARDEVRRQADARELPEAALPALLEQPLGARDRPQPGLAIAAELHRRQPQDGEEGILGRRL